VSTKRPEKAKRSRSPSPYISHKKKSKFTSDAPEAVETEEKQDPSADLFVKGEEGDDLLNTSSPAKFSAIRPSSVAENQNSPARKKSRKTKSNKKEKKSEKKADRKEKRKKRPSGKRKRKSAGSDAEKCGLSSDDESLQAPGGLVSRS